MRPSKKGNAQSTNQGPLKISKAEPKPMNGQALGFRKERKKKKEAQPSLCEENFLESLEKD